MSPKEPRSRFRTGLALLPVIVVGGSCLQDADAPVSLTETADTAGVMLATSAGPHWADSQGWSIGEEWPRELEGVERWRTAELDRVGSIAMLRTGVVAVASGREVLAVMPDGTTEVIATGGDGPGEFRSPPVLRALSDSLVAFDAGARRISIFDPDLRLGRTIPVPGGPFSRSLALTDAGAVLLVANSAVPQRPGAAEVRTVPLVLVRWDGARLDTLALVRGSPLVRISTPSGELIERPPWAPTPAVAGSGSQVYFGDGADLELRRLDVDRGLHLIARGRADLRVSASEFEDARSLILGDNPSPTLRAAVDGLFSALDQPVSRPGFDRILVDPSGATWLGPFVPEWDSERPQIWTVFSPAGEWLGGVPLPLGFDLHEIGASFVVGVQRDELGREHLRALQLHR